MIQNDRLNHLIAPTIEAMGYEFWGCEFYPHSPAMLRIYIDRASGVNIDDCSLVSRQLSALLDVENLIKGAYQLEVSSPGLERPLFTLEHFKRFIDHKISVQLYAPMNGQRNFTGRLMAIENDKILLETETGKNTILFTNIAKAKLING